MPKFIKKIITLTKAVHFNPKYPEYHNVYISNMRSQHAMMYDGEQWTLISKEELIGTIYDDKKTYIEDNLEEFVNSLSKSKKDALKRWLNTDDDNEKIKAVKKSIKLLLYNKNKMIIDTRKKVENQSKTITHVKSNEDVEIDGNDVVINENNDSSKSSD